MALAGKSLSCCIPQGTTCMWEAELPVARLCRLTPGLQGPRVAHDDELRAVAVRTVCQPTCSTSLAWPYTASSRSGLTYSPGGRERWEVRACAPVQAMLR